MYPLVPTLGTAAVLYAVLVAAVATTALTARTPDRRRTALTVLKLLLCRG